MAFLESGQGGDYGRGLEITVYPDATFAAEITALSNAHDIIGRVVSWVTTANMSVTSPAASAIPDGKVIDVEPDNDNTWALTVRFWGYADVEGNRWPCNQIIEMPLSSTVASLGQEVQVDGSSYNAIKGVNTGGSGKVVSVNGSSYASFVI